MKKRLIILSTLLGLVVAFFGAPAQAMLPAEEMLSASVQECAPGFVSGNTEFVYIATSDGCRAYLVYSSTYFRLALAYPDIYPQPQMGTDPRFPGWQVVYRVGSGDAEDVAMRRRADGQLLEQVYQRRGSSERVFSYPLPERFAH